MKLTIENGSLKACILDEQEQTVRLPAEVRVIDDFAFSQVSSGQIRHLYLPDSIEKISFHAFDNLGKLTSVTAYTYEMNPNHICWHGFYSIQMDTLILLPGKSGKFFTLPDRVPKKLVMEKGMDIRYGYSETYEINWETEIESLIVYNMHSSEDDEAWIDRYFLSSMSNHLKKLHFMNNSILDREQSTYYIWEYKGNKIPSFIPSELKNGYNWADTMISDEITDMNALEEVILPEGLIEVKRCAFQYCISLRKVVFPASLEKIGESAFRGCSMLRTVLFCKDTKAVIGQNSFAGCDSLRSISFYESSGNGLVKKKTSSESVATFLSCNVLPLSRMQLKIFEYWNRLDDEQQKKALSYIKSVLE